MIKSDVGILNKQMKEEGYIVEKLPLTYSDEKSIVETWIETD